MININIKYNITKLITKVALNTNTIASSYAVRGSKTWKGEKRLLFGIWFLKVDILIQSYVGNTIELQK